MDNRQFRHVCFTLNNYTEEEYKQLIEMECKYLVIGKEVGEEGTPHLQGYIEFKTPKRFSTLKNINQRIHWEERRGTAKQASEYCKKEGNFIERRHDFATRETNRSTSCMRNIGA